MLKISLAAARVNRGFTQREVAEKLGISTKTLVNWENGITFPTIERVYELCELYCVSVDNLIFLPEDNA